MAKWLARLWPRLLAELNRVGGLGALGGAALAVAAFFSRGALRASFVGIGVFIVVLTIGVALKRAIPPRLRHPKDVEGQELTLQDLRSFAARVPALGIIGPDGRKDNTAQPPAAGAREAGSHAKDHRAC